MYSVWKGLNLFRKPIIQLGSQLCCLTNARCLFGTETHFGLKNIHSVGKQALVVWAWGWGMGWLIGSCKDYRKLLKQMVLEKVLPRENQRTRTAPFVVCNVLPKGRILIFFECICTSSCFSRFANNICNQMLLNY